MDEGNQLEFDLDQRQQDLDIIMKRLKENQLRNSGTSLEIRKETVHYWLVVRTFIYEVEREYIEKLTMEDVIYLKNKYNVDDYWIRKE